jgi:hypothetical protein
MKKDLFSVLYSLDKKIWGDQIATNRYLATVTLICCVLFGVILGSGKFLNGLFDWSLRVSIVATIASTIMLIGFNIIESIIAAKTAKIATLRSLMITGILILGLVVGFVGSVVALAILTVVITIYLAILLLGALLGGGSGGSGGRKKWKLSNGDEVTEEKGLCGESYYTGSSGTSYDTNDGGNTFYEK